MAGRRRTQGSLGLQTQRIPHQIPLDVQLGPVPVEVEGVPGLYGLEMDPEAKLSNLLPKVGEAVNNMGSGGMGGFGGLGMMLDPSAKDELNDMKSDIKTADMILPGLDEALAFDELLKHMENPTWDVVVFDTAPTGHTLRFLSLPELIEAWSGRLLRLMRVSGGIRSMLFGRKESEAMKEELERFRRRVLHVRRVLSDPATSPHSPLSPSPNAWASTKLCGPMNRWWSTTFPSAAAWSIASRRNSNTNFCKSDGNRNLNALPNWMKNWAW